MSFLEFIRVALGSIVANKIRALLTTLGVIIGVLAVILLVALGDGARAYLDRMFAGIGSNLIIVRPGRRETKGMTPPMNTTYKITLEDVRALAHRATADAGGRGRESLTPAETKLIEESTKRRYGEV